MWINSAKGLIKLYCPDCHVNASVPAAPVRIAPQIYEHYNNTYNTTVNNEVNTTARCEYCHANNITNFILNTYTSVNLTFVYNVSHYGGKPSFNTQACTACHINSTNGTTWGNASQVNGTQMGGTTVALTMTSGECQNCHGNASEVSHYTLNFHNASLNAGVSCIKCHSNSSNQTMPQVNYTSFNQSVHTNGSVDLNANCVFCHSNSNNTMSSSANAQGLVKLYCPTCHVNRTTSSGAPQIYEHYNNAYNTTVTSDVNTTSRCEDCHSNNFTSFTLNTYTSVNTTRLYNVSHYGGNPSLNTQACTACHINATNGTTWGNATQVNGTTMGNGTSILLSTTSDECQICHGNVTSANTNFHNSSLQRGKSCTYCHTNTSEVANTNGLNAQPSGSLVDLIFTASKHGSRQCSPICHPTSEMLDSSRVAARVCGVDCHNLTTRYSNESYGMANHSTKNVGCTACHGKAHAVGTLTKIDICSVCHSSKDKHLPYITIADANPASENKTFRCASCHYTFHSKTMTAPNCAPCHELDRLQKTGDVCEKCHGSLHDKHMGKDCVDCHDKIHDSPRSANCKNCHTMVEKTSGKTLIPHTECRGCHEHLQKPADTLTFCKNCHKEKEAGLMHTADLKTKIHAEVSKANKNCMDCHKDGVSNKPDCTTCHNVHKVHENKGTCMSCHGLLKGERTHYTMLCSVCHKTEGDVGATASNLLPGNVSIGITKPGTCESCHLYKQNSHETCDRCHTAEAQTDLSSFDVISNYGVGIYGVNSSDASTAKYLREGTTMRATPDTEAENVITHKPLYNNLSLSWTSEIAFANADTQIKINVTPVMTIFNATAGTVTNDTGINYLVIERLYPTLKLIPVIEKKLMNLSAFDVKAATTFKGSIKLELVGTGRGTLHIINGDSIEGNVNLDDNGAYLSGAVNDNGVGGVRDTGNDISNAVHLTSDVLDDYYVFVTDASKGNISIAIAKADEVIKISDGQKNVFGYAKVQIPPNSQYLQFEGDPVTFLNWRKQSTVTQNNYTVIVGGPESNSLSASENADANIFFKTDAGKIELNVDGNTYTFTQDMWGKEDYGVLKMMDTKVYAEGCTRYGTDAAVKILKSGTTELQDKKTAILHWKDFNGNGAVDLDEIEINYALR